VSEPDARTGAERTNRGDTLGRLEALHDAVESALAPLRERHGDRLRCRRGCAACCIDDLSVFEVEAERIRTRAGAVLRETPHPPGACAFLDERGACRIYPWRPYVCRTQGLPLRWIDYGGSEGAVERRDICALNDAGEPIEELPRSACWELGPAEGRLASLQAEQQRAEAPGTPLRRVRLRDLFAAGPKPAS